MSPPSRVEPACGRSVMQTAELGIIAFGDGALNVCKAVDGAVSGVKDVLSDETLAAIPA